MRINISHTGQEMLPDTFVVQEITAQISVYCLTELKISFEGYVCEFDLIVLDWVHPNQ